MAYTEEELKKELETKEYEYGFYTDIESDTFPVGLNEEVIRKISEKKEEPEWMTQWRLEAYESFKEMTEPEWANVNYKKPDLQAISYYSAPKQKPKYDSLNEVDPELLKTFDKLGISLEEQKKTCWGCRGYCHGFSFCSYHIQGNPSRKRDYFLLHL